MDDELIEKINLLAIQISLNENLIYEHDNGQRFCVLCYADVLDCGDIKHDHDCPVTLANEILKALDENPSS